MKDQDNGRFKIATFLDDLRSRLVSSRENLEYLVDAYNWWQWPDNDREMRRAYPDARRGWLRQEIMRIFNVDPQMLSKIVTRLAGSKTANKRKVAWRFAKRIGTWELYHADRVLKPEQLQALPGKFLDGDFPISPEESRTVIDDMAQILKSRPKLGDSERIDYRREYLKLLQQNAGLKKEVELLRGMLGKTAPEVAPTAKP